MGGLFQQSANPGTQPSESSFRPVLIGIAIVAVIVGIVALLLRSEQKKPFEPNPYAANLQFSDLKASAAQTSPAQP